MTQPTDDQLAAAAQKARADHETARAIAARLLAPPDPVDILAGVIADHGEVADERDELQAKCDALTADLEAIRFMVGRHEAPIVEAVRQLRDKLIRDHLAHADRERLSAMLKAAEADAETQRTAAVDLRAALDRVATAAGVDTDSTGAIVADRVIAVLRAMQARPMLTVERLADALRAASVTLEPTMAARAVMAAMSHMDLVLPESSPTSRPAALPADLRTYLETRRDRLQGGHGLGLAAEIAALNRWLALPTAEVAP